jgi:hypothetical protein
MMLPIIARASDVVLRVVPGNLREASLALGASRWKTVWHVVLPTARPGLATAVILGLARGVGETSPVLLTSGAATRSPRTRRLMNSLPLYIYTLVRSGEPARSTAASAAPPCCCSSCCPLRRRPAPRPAPGRPAAPPPPAGAVRSSPWPLARCVPRPRRAQRRLT